MYLRNMRALSVVFLILASLCPALGSAETLDPFRIAQSATTVVGKGADSTKVSAGKGGHEWSTRTFTARATKVCRPSAPSLVGLASAGTGTADGVLMNAHGKISVTWLFPKSAPVSSLARIELDLVAGKESASVLSDLLFTATLHTQSAKVSVRRSEYKVSRNTDSTERTISFDFKEAAAALFATSEVVRSLTVEVESRSACDVSLGLKTVRSLPSPRLNAKSRGRVGKAEAASDEDDFPVEAGTPVATPTPQVNPCDEDPSVPDQIRECEERANLLASGCQEWKCTCSPNFKDNTYRIFSTSSWSGDGSAGASCKNNMCGGAAGRCTEYGRCIPAQFYDWKHPHIGVDADGIVFKGFDNPLDTGCFEWKKFPTTRQLCSMRPDEVERAVSGSVVVGKQCDLSENSKGVCDQQGKCVPDPSADYFCRDKVNCTQCGSGTGNICWNHKCLTYEEATFKVCESTSFFGGSGRGICGPCMAFFNIKDGTCSASVISRNPSSRREHDPPIVSMDGASCRRTETRGEGARYQYNGRCENGACVPTVTATVTPGR